VLSTKCEAPLFCLPKTPLRAPCAVDLSSSNKPMWSTFAFFFQSCAVLVLFFECQNPLPPLLLPPLLGGVPPWPSFFGLFTSYSFLHHPSLTEVTENRSPRVVVFADPLLFFFGPDSTIARLSSETSSFLISPFSPLAFHGLQAIPKFLKRFLAHRTQCKIPFH